MHVTYITRGYIIMSESFFYSVKDLSKDENSVISYFFYKICLGVESY